MKISMTNCLKHKEIKVLVILIRRKFLIFILFIEIF